MILHAYEDSGEYAKWELEAKTKHEGYFGQEKIQLRETGT
jgi:hypothetical protein